MVAVRLGWGPMVRMRQTYLFCAWLAWARFRVVIPTWDKTVGSVLVCLDGTLRRIGAVPTYALTDNERTVSMDRVAGVSVPHPEVVAFGRHYGLRIVTCVPADPESKGGAESTVRVAKADLVPTECNLLPTYDTFPSLITACDGFCAEINAREHRESRRVPNDALLEEQAQMHRLPLEPYTAALGQTRRVETNQTIRFGSVRYSLPKAWVDQEVWCRVEGDELVVVGRDDLGLREIWRHELSVPGRPRILDAHYPGHPKGRATLQPTPKPQTETERAFLSLGEGAEIWLTTAAAAGVTRIRAKMGRATELAALLGVGRVNAALHRAAHAGRFGENDLASILDHLEVAQAPSAIADDQFSIQRSTRHGRCWGDEPPTRPETYGSSRPHCGRPGPLQRRGF